MNGKEREREEFDVNIGWAIAKSFGAMRVGKKRERAKEGKRN